MMKSSSDENELCRRNSDRERRRSETTTGEALRLGAPACFHCNFCVSSISLLASVLKHMAKDSGDVPRIVRATMVRALQRYAEPA